MPAKPIPASEIHIRLGAAFRAARERQGVTQEVVRKGLGVSINTIRWHEAGARCLRADQIVEAARIMGCKAPELINVEQLDGPDAA